MFNLLRKLVPERSPLRLSYHKLSATVAAVVFGFPANKLRMVGVTGTSGKSSVVELCHHLIQHGGQKCGAISTVNMWIGDQCIPNQTLRTSLRSWHTQWLLRKMVHAGCETCVVEVSSHALDQHRVLGIAFDIAVLTNIRENEHLDYHGTFAHYLRTKMKLFQGLNTSLRKPHIPKVMILNAEDDHYKMFQDIPCDQRWTYSTGQEADFQAQNTELGNQGMKFSVRLPNHSLQVQAPLIGKHNLENAMAAVATATVCGVDVSQIPKAFQEFPGIPGRLEPINVGQDFSVLVDFSYKPAALEAVLKTLKEIISGRIICVWGGAGGRLPDNWHQSAQILDQMCDEIVLTTDDPYAEDPRIIAQEVQEHIHRKEGAGFFEIEDRYEAIRYAIYTAEPGDCVLVAGRGHEATQVIGTQRIHFDDREVCREILAFAKKERLLPNSSPVQSPPVHPSVHA